MSVKSQIDRIKGVVSEQENLLQQMKTNLVGKAAGNGGGVELPTLENQGNSGDLLEGKQLINQSGIRVIGRMPNKGAIDVTVDGLTTKSYTVPEGYHNGSGKVSLTDDIDNIALEQGDLIQQIKTALSEKAAGEDPVIQALTVTENGTYAPPAGVDGYAPVTVNVPQGAQLPTLDNPGTAADLAEGKQLIGSDGEVVTGKVTRYTNDDTHTFIGTEVKQGVNNKVGIWRITDKVEMMDAGTGYGLYAEGSNFGDAGPGDVRAGKTFTSQEGLKITGEALLPGGGFVYPDGAFTPVTSFTDGKQYALVSMIGGVRRYINTTDYNQYTMNATEITIGEDAGDYVIFSETPALFTAVASGDGFLLQNGTNYLHGTSSGGTALRVGTTQMVWTVDTSETGGFSEGKYNAKEDANAVWLMNASGGYNWSIKYETTGSFGYDRDGRDNTYSTGFVPFVLYEYVAGEGEVSPIVDTSDASVTANQMLAGASGYAKGRRVEGNIQSKGADTIEPGTTEKYIEPGVYLAGRQTIAAIQTQTKTATANGTVTPDAGKYLSSVTVNVPSSGVTLPDGAVVVQKVLAAQASQQIGSGYSLSVTYGDNVEINDSIALAFSGTTKTLSNISTSTDFSVLLGKYVRSGSSMGGSTGTFYYIPDDATFTVGGQSMSKTLTCDKAQKVSMQKVSV